MSEREGAAGHLPRAFRKLTFPERRDEVRRLLAARGLPIDADAVFGSDESLLELADVMAESAVGYLTLPFGVATGFVVDGEAVDLPMVTEEPSVIAAACYAAGIVARAGGFVTTPGEPITTGQLFIENSRAGAEEAILQSGGEIRDALKPTLAGMEARGGGLRGVRATRLAESRTLKVEIDIDVRDAMGANVVNSAAELLKPLAEQISGGRCLLAIVSNAAERRTTTAEFSVPVGSLSRAGLPGTEMARRIVAADRIAGEDAGRAITHNKGIMNAISAVALATGNDTRALEASIHGFAARDGRYRGLTRYELDGETLAGSLILPLLMGTIGGAAGLHPASRAALVLLGNPDAVRLARIAAAAGLAQNFAALLALVGEGIQAGHMKMHERRLAWIERGGAPRTGEP